MPRQDTSRDGRSRTRAEDGKHRAVNAVPSTVTGVLVLATVLVLSTAVGLVHRRRDGRLRRPTARPTADAADLRPLLGGRRAGERVTLLQFSSAFCAPCRATRRTLSEVAAVVPGVTHVELDAEACLDVVRRLDVRRTPTTLVLDAHGREVGRAGGQPRKAEVLRAIEQALPS